MRSDIKCCRGCGAQNNTKKDAWVKLQHVEEKCQKNKKNYWIA
jgi:hypothetical protein